MRSMSGFGLVEFFVVRDGSSPDMPGWEQASFTNTEHIPGSDRNETFLLGMGPLQRTLTLECPSAAHYRTLVAMVQTQAVLRIPATINELDVPEVDYFGTVYAEIPDVLLVELRAPRVSIDGAVSVQATFQRQGDV